MNAGKAAENMAIEITVNSEARAVPEGSTLLVLLEALGLDPKVVAAQINDAIVPRNTHAGVVLQAGDKVDLVRFVGGG